MRPTIFSYLRTRDDRGESMPNLFPAISKTPLDNILERLYRECWKGRPIQTVVESKKAETVRHGMRSNDSEANLITCRREGQFVYSEARPETIAAYTRALARIARGNQPARRR